MWEPTFGGIAAAVASGFGNIRALELPEGIQDDHPGDGVVAKSLITGFRAPFGIWTFEFGYAKLYRFLGGVLGLDFNDPATLARHTFPYDWRLSNRYNAGLLKAFSESALEDWRTSAPERADAKITFVCHSMGGLIARWYLDQLGGSEITEALITMATPHRGALNALDQISNGVRKGPGPFKLDLTEFARSLPSLYQLLPEYACVDRVGNPLTKTTEVSIADLDPVRAKNAMKFHTDLDQSRAKKAPAYSFYPIVGTEQPTLATARYTTDGHVLGVYTIEGNDQFGDGTVPRFAAAPIDVQTKSPILHYVEDNHAGVVCNQGAFDQLQGILTATAVRYRGDVLRLRVDAPEIVDAGENVAVEGQVVNGEAPLELVLHGEDGMQINAPVRLLERDGVIVADTGVLSPGAYRLTVQGAADFGGEVAPVSSLLSVMPASG
ncbi:MAG: hypothetical protein ABI435_06020 [Pseudolysinimonas sp.]